MFLFFFTPVINKNLHLCLQIIWLHKTPPDWKTTKLKAQKWQLPNQSLTSGGFPFHSTRLEMSVGLCADSSFPQCYYAVRAVRSVNMIFVFIWSLSPNRSSTEECKNEHNWCCSNTKTSSISLLFILFSSFFPLHPFSVVLLPPQLPIKHLVQPPLKWSC